MKYLTIVLTFSLFSLSACAQSDSTNNQNENQENGVQPG